MLAWLLSKYKAPLHEQNNLGQNACFKAEQAWLISTLEWLKQAAATNPKPADLKKSKTPGQSQSSYRQETPDAATPQGPRPSPYRSADEPSVAEL